MTPQAQQLALALLCGWEPGPDGKRWKSPYGRAYFLYRKPFGEAHTYHNALPDYTDLNALHGAERQLLTTRDLCERYEEELCGAAWDETQANAFPASGFSWHYGPEHRRAALLRVFGKWEGTAL